MEKKHCIICGICIAAALTALITVIVIHNANKQKEEEYDAFLETTYQEVPGEIEPTFIEAAEIAQHFLKSRAAEQVNTELGYLNITIDEVYVYNATGDYTIDVTFSDERYYGMGYGQTVSNGIKWEIIVYNRDNEEIDHLFDVIQEF